MRPRFTRLSPAREIPGTRQYEVAVEGAGRIGIVTNRRGGYWRAQGVDGRTSSGFCRTRAEAVAAILPVDETGVQT